MMAEQPPRRPGSRRSFAARVGTVPASALVPALVSLLVSVAFALAPSAHATPLFVNANYNLNIPGRFDFHTWIFNVTPCLGSCQPCEGECREISAIAQPIARAYQFNAPARLVDGQWTMTVDNPIGLRCGNVYYGPSFPTHDVYTWDENTLAGQLVSSFDVGCDGAPGTLTYPFWLTRL